VTDPLGTGDDRLICLSEAVVLVPFSETTLRRAIVRGELVAWQPNGNGKLVMWRSALIAWATRRPAHDRQASDAPVSVSRRRGANAGQLLPDRCPTGLRCLI
jgi:hypothetical protein